MTTLINEYGHALVLRDGLACHYCDHAFMDEWWRFGRVQLWHGEMHYMDWDQLSDWDRRHYPYESPHEDDRLFGAEWLDRPENNVPDADLAVMPAPVLRKGRRSRRRPWAPWYMIPTVDHLIPKSRGGSNELENLVLACWPCNMEKGTQSAISYRALWVWRKAHGLYWDVE